MAVEPVEIGIETRPVTGSSESRRLRRQGLIPTVVYQHGQPSIPAILNARQFVQLASNMRGSQLFVLKSKDERINGRSALVKEVQRSYLKAGVEHVDFLAVRDDEELNVNIAIHLIGESPGVKNEGGILTIVSHELSVRCLPRLIPSHIEVDISGLGLGTSIHARDIKLADGVKLHGNPDETIVSVVAVRAAAEEETSTAAQSAAAPAADAAATAAAPAGQAAASKDKAGKDKK